VTKRAKVIWSLVASLVLAGGGVGAIAVFGYTSEPKYALLQTHPDPAISGTIAYLGLSDDEERYCVFVVAASGGDPREVTCNELSTDVLAFTAEGKLVVGGRHYESGPEHRFVVYDPTTLAEMERFTRPDAIQEAEEEEPELFTSAMEIDSDIAAAYDNSLGLGQVSTAHDRAHTAWVARDVDGRDRLLHREAPADYDFASAQYSPDQKWVLVFDSNSDLLIGNESNAIKKLVSTYDVHEDEHWQFPDDVDFGRSEYRSMLAAWFQPGQTRGTVVVDDLKNAPVDPVTDALMDESFSYQNHEFFRVALGSTQGSGE
jgi:hypothetical protein